MSPERRQRRSANPFLALTYWLEAATKRSEMSGFVLADAGGNVLATSLSSGHTREVAAVAPLMARGDDWSPFTSLFVKQLPTAGGALLLCAVCGTEAARCDTTLEAVAAGVRRIIRELLGGAWAPL